MSKADENLVANYLVLAHQTATSRALLEKLREIAGRNQGAKFTLLVPATPVQHLLTWTEGESIAAARRTALEARTLFEQSGLRVAEALTGDPSPVQAIADTLARNESFEAIVISTSPPGISRWLKLDLHTRAREKFRLPVISVVASREVLAAA